SAPSAGAGADRETSTPRGSPWRANVANGSEHVDGVRIDLDAHIAEVAAVRPFGERAARREHALLVAALHEQLHAEAVAQARDRRRTGTEYRERGRRRVGPGAADLPCVQGELVRHAIRL